METLNTAEARAATTNLDQANTALTTSEENPSFVSSVAGRTVKGKGKGFFKGKGPIGLIIALVFGVGGVMLGAQSLLPFHIIELFEQVHDVSYVSRQARAPKLLKYIFNLENDDSKVTSRTFWGDYRKFNTKITKKAAKLADNGIEIVKKGTVIDGDIEVPSGTTLKVKDYGTVTLDTDTNIATNQALKGATLDEDILIYHGDSGDTLISANKYGDLYWENSSLRNSVNNSLRSGLGRIAAWTDASAAKFFLDHKLTKNLFGNWSRKKLDELSAETDVNDVIRARTGGDGSLSSSTRNIVNNDDGTSSTPSEPTNNSGKVKSKADITSTLNNIGQAATNITCGLAAVSAAATAIKIATAISNAQSYFVAYAEASDKVKAGDGNASPIHELTNSMVAKDTDGYSALEDEGMIWTLSGGTANINKNNPTTLATNVESIFRNLGATAGTVIACSISRAALAVVSSVLTVVTFGTFSLGKTLFSIGAETTIAGIVGTIINNHLSKIDTNICLDTSGKEKGACFDFGGRNTFNGNALYGGGMPGDKNTVIAFYRQQAEILAQEAEYDRSTHSPFDITNSNTFLGSLVTRTLIPLASAGGNFSKSVSIISNATSSSLISLLPTANAIDESSYLANNIGDCPSLKSIGAVGDIYCNPIITSDSSTNDLDPESNMINISKKYNSFKTDNNGNLVLNDKGTESINSNSNLAKFILYCTRRSSQFGAVDYNILSQQHMSTTENDTLDSVLSAVPVLGDLIEIVQSGKDLATLPWATGANCVARSGDSNSLDFYYEDKESGDTGGDTLALDSWKKEMARYQRYVEDDRIMQAMDDEYQSAIVAFLEEYEQENPVDNSFEGVLARKTGYTKDQIISALNELEYENYIANYDPTERFQFVPTAAPADDIYFESTSASNTLAVLPRVIVFTDLRNKFFAIS